MEDHYTTYHLPPLTVKYVLTAAGSVLIALLILVALLFFFRMPLYGTLLSFFPPEAVLEECIQPLPAEIVALDGCCNMIDDDQNGFADCDDESCSQSNLCARGGVVHHVCTGTGGSSLIVRSDSFPTVCSARIACIKHWTRPADVEGNVLCLDGQKAACWYASDSEEESEEFEALYY